MPTKEEIEAAKTPNGGWTREQLAKWGIPWPPPRGWKRRLESMTADIEPLPGLEWNAHAALHDALNRCAIDRPVVILWIEEDGRVCHSSSALRKDVLWMLETKKQRVMND